MMGIASKKIDKVVVDWFAVICDLSNSLGTLTAVAIALDVPKTTLISWKQGTEPPHSKGEKLIKLWLSTTNSDRQNLPVVDSSNWWAMHHHLLVK